MTYTPREGSIVERAFAVLEPGKEMTARDLSDHCECDENALASSMNTPIGHGAVSKVRRNGVIVYSRPANQSQPPGPVSLEKDCIFPALGVFPPATLPSADEPEVKTATRLGIDVAQGHSTFAVALYSDGRLLLEFGPDDGRMLSPEDTKTLVRYLDRMVLDEGSPS